MGGETVEQLATRRKALRRLSTVRNRPKKARVEIDAHGRNASCDAVQSPQEAHVALRHFFPAQTQRALKGLPFDIPD